MMPHNGVWPLEVLKLHLALSRALPPPHTPDTVNTSAANRLIGEVVQSRRRPPLGPFPS